MLLFVVARECVDHSFLEEQDDESETYNNSNK